MTPRPALTPLAFALLLTLPTQAWPQAATPPVSAMVRHYVVLLVAGPNASMSEAEASALMPQHLAHLERLVTSGVGVVAGPAGDEGRVRGIMVLRAASPGEARQWAEADPAVKAGRLAVDVHAWWHQDGLMRPVFDSRNVELLYVGFLVKGAQWTQESTRETREIELRHQAHLEALWKAGALLIAGPCEGEGDVRGIVVYRTATIDEARRFAEEDPAVVTGRLAVRLHPWHVAKGAFTQ